MERDSHFIAVGLFVLVLITGGALFVGWLAGNAEEQSRLRYSVYFQGGVFGLSEGGPVRFLGVQVGNIYRIGLAPSRPDSVHVIIEVDQTAPIYTDTTAELKTQGITGLAYIELRKEGGAAEPLSVSPGEPYPVIRSVPNDLDEFISSLPRMTARFEQISKQVLKLLSDDNVDALSSSMKHLELASAKLPDTLSAIEIASREITQSFDRMESAADKLGKASDSVTDGMSSFVPQANSALANADELLKDLTRLSNQLNERVAHNGEGIDRVFDQTLPDLADTMTELRSTLSRLNRLVDNINSDPSQLLYKPNYKTVNAK